MSNAVLKQTVLENAAFWQGKNALLPEYDRRHLPVKSLCFSAGRMAYAHTGDILQDLLNEDAETGMMVGVETFAERYCAELAACDYLMTQLIYENEKGKVVPKVQGAIKRVLFVDGDTNSLTWKRLSEYSRDPNLQFATINAPEGAYGAVYAGGEFATPTSDTVKKDMAEGTVNSDAAIWTAFALERFKAGLPFALVSCTNFSGNGHYTAGTVKMVAKAWEDAGHAPKGFLDYLSDPKRFTFPNTMIDRIAVPPDEATEQVMNALGVASSIVVTEKTRYWVVEDAFPAGRPAFENAAGVFMEDSYEEVKKYEDMKLRILNMAHSVMAGIGVLLGHSGQYGIYRAMQDDDIGEIIDRIIEVVFKTIEHPKKMDPRDFARDTIERLNNANIPDDPMRIALNGSTKIQPRFMDTFYAGEQKGIDPTELNLLLVSVAGFLRYTLGVDDAGNTYELEGDPIRDRLVSCGKAAKIGDPSSAKEFRPLIASTDVMGKDLYAQGDVGARVEEMVAKMLAREGAVRSVVQDTLRG